MNARKLLLTISLLLILLFAGTLSVFAEEDGSYHYAQVFDEAGLFSESQVLQLETLCEDITLNYDIDVIILTTLQIPESSTLRIIMIPVIQNCQIPFFCF